MDGELTEKSVERWVARHCHAFLDNAVRLQLFALAYNLDNFLRRIQAIE